MLQDNEINLEMYHRSIADEIKARKDRVRNLIGNAHWGEEGIYKEAVLRSIIETYLPKNFEIGTGFVLYKNGISTQLDVLITNKQKPLLFCSGHQKIVTPDTVEAIIEVKTKLDSISKFYETFCKIGMQASKIRQVKKYFKSCLVGLFIYNYNRIENFSEIILDCLNKASQNKKERVINYITIGPKKFIRFWENKPNITKNETKDNSYNTWHFYDLINQDYDGFSYTYFLGNLINNIGDLVEGSSNYAWFPIKKPNGKEYFRTFTKSLNE